jgi:hypothetical protein
LRRGVSALAGDDPSRKRESKNSRKRERKKNFFAADAA